nr:Chain P, Rhodopsin Epitope Mimetic Peptide [synthetic construct]1XGY_Q Chain Q, Rhodopsin Epitope Mimetic Peptide [synthetic construct]
TGALQERSK